MKIFIVLLLLIGKAQALEIHHWKTPEGAKVLFAQTKGLPMLDISLSFNAASATDGKKFGLANLTNSLLGTASKTHEHEEIIQLFESVGAQFSKSAYQDMAIVSLRTLVRQQNLHTALKLFAEVIASPIFKQVHLNREKKQTLRLIEASKQSPASVAEQAFEQIVFANHPYAHDKLGTPETLSKINIEDIRTHYQRYYVAKNATIALVGDISKTHAKQIARQLSHGLRIGRKTTPKANIHPLTKSHHKHIEFPSKQTHLLIGQTGINRAHPDYYALYLGNHIFGGNGLSSILNDKIREQKGLVYSITSYFSKMQSNGYFLIKLATKNTQADEAKRLALKTFKNFLSDKIDPQKLQDGKDNIIGGFALKTASNDSISTYLSVIGFYGLPLDYLSSFTNKIKNISAEDIQAAFGRLIDTNKLIVLSVGQAE